MQDQLLNKSPKTYKFRQKFNFHVVFYEVSLVVPDICFIIHIEYFLNKISKEGLLEGKNLNSW